ncbi:hypothetical protein C7999DRAFT_42108 [Corynascus novoguineensis]|uniref:Uncharacterized protein n=1 Tax=Corynascus novoguineensis TaxID=1126955 RepID=A0AAN7CR98_9PEZI|nr:hypothetical protein C7999DRAFT_42108 [Corynascus novoguineensis]
MVGGRKVLLSIAVLSGLGLEPVLGGRLRRQDGFIDTAQGAAGAASSSTSSQTDVVPLLQSSSKVAIVATPSDQSRSAAEGVGISPDSQQQRTSSSLGPPPADIPESSTSVPPVQGGGSEPDSPGYTYAPAESASATVSAGAQPTPPRGGPPRGGPPGGIPKGSSFSATYATTETVDLGYGTTLPGDSTLATSIRYENQTFTQTPSGSISYCKPSELAGSPTSWSVIHTSTITWYGNPEDYTQPYPPIAIPGPTSSCVVPITPPKLTISVCASTGVGTQYMTCEVTTTTESYKFGVQTSLTPSVVFLTTDKNPAVIFTTINKPDYGVSQDAQTRDGHASPTAYKSGSSADYNTPGGPQAISNSAQRPTRTPITVAVQPTGVVIDGHTIRDNPAEPTQVVIIGGQTFTIDPTHVVGGGATIDRPAATGGVYLPVPTSTDIDGVPVVVSSSVAIIGGSSFTLGPSTTTAVVSGHTFTVGPSTIAGGTQTLPLPTFPSPTEVVVAGGDLITAIGSSVFVVHGTTLTYPGPGGDGGSTVITVDDDVVTLGPGGITAQDGAVTLGGTHAAGPQDTQYALVGGATITKIGASVVVIRNTTYTVGPGTDTPTMTTVIGGETITVGPDGVVVGSLTLRYPFGPTTVITPGAGADAATATATAGTGGGDEEDGVGALRPWLAGVVWAVGLAVGIGLVI